ncbi:MAG: trimethylamine methyltransferase family protein [Desulfitobacterium hafniense]|nr:trimethylamine methyltransferase family protein [Desulfitobacterium hafniense]
MRFEILSEQEVKQVHEASLEILKRVGIHTASQKFKEILLDNGCKEQGERIVFTDDVIYKGLKTVPATFELYGRNNSYVLEIGKKKAYCQTCVGTPSMIDLDTGEKRDTLTKDLEEYTRLADALEYINIISPVFPRDVPQEIILTVETATLLRNTSKPLSICIESEREMPYIIELLTAVAGSAEALKQKPIATIPISPLSPLEYGYDPAEALIAAVEAGLPLGVEPCPMMGSTGPMTLLGTAVQHNAEILAGVIASQLIKPGSAVTHSSRATFMDMRSGLGLWAMPELGYAGAIMNQLAQYANIPCAPGGYCGASKTTDMQSGYEHLYNALLEGLVGSDIIGSAGSLDNALISCYAMLVIDNELSSVVQRTIKDFEVTEDKLAVNIIAEVIEKKSNFLEHKHTRKHFRAGELWLPPLGDRQTYEKWAVSKEKIEDKARRTAKELIAAHQVIPLSEEINREFDRIIAYARKIEMK